MRTPTLVIHGEQDPVIRPKGGRATAAAIPAPGSSPTPAWATTCPGAVAVDPRRDLRAGRPGPGRAAGLTRPRGSKVTAWKRRAR
ncbi:MAG: hypothetical protein ABJB47_18115 [Actinomycetota bacterium]